MIIGHRQGKNLWKIILLIAFLLPHPGHGETVESKLSSGIIVTADHRQGRAELPAILLLHGFLQTRDAPPMSRLGDTLAESGYSVLAPTLSLGVSRRARSLACESVHTHSMEDDVKEIDHWVNWLAAKGHTNIVLIGHSMGSLQMLAYLTMRPPHPAIAKVILTSLIPPHIDQKERDQALGKPPLSDEGSGQSLGRYTISYCKKSYVASPRAYISYAEWTREQALDALGKTRIRPEVILGGKDRLIGPDWPEKIRSRGIAVTVIGEAGHFFDGAHEFDLSDSVEASLKSSRRGK